MVAPAAGSFARSAHPIEREIEVENVNSPLADKGEQAALLVRPDQCLDLREREIPRAGHPGGLIMRTCRADFRVETARRGGHEVDRNRLTVVGVCVMHVSYTHLTLPTNREV